ncbi:hypothetical protein DMA11_08045 [Marinilabiliaceae bacterium JC017]|nr:hypothetical protein DMA11_08045 [Marinilabiliaceae bacterium JC017]
MNGPTKSARALSVTRFYPRVFQNSIPGYYEWANLRVSWKNVSESIKLYRMKKRMNCEKKNKDLILMRSFCAGFF